MKANILLEGEIGVGKTRSLMTLLPNYMDEHGKVREGAGKRTFLVSLEPGAEATLGGNMCNSSDDAGIHLHYIKPLALSWDDMAKWAKLLNTLPLDKVITLDDPNKRQCTQFLDLMNVCANFTCDRCGHDFGDAGEWDDNYALALDGLSNLTAVARHLCVGLKPILSRPEYNPVMETIENFLRLFWGSTKCSAILLSHIDREQNPVTGLSSITMHTIGQKLAPRIAKMPDEIIVANYDEGKYTWETDIPGHITKVRNMPRGTGLAADFSAHPLFGA